MVDSPQDLARLATSIAREAAALALEVRERVVAPPQGLDTKSSATDVVTEGDRACEALVRDRLSALRPGDAVLGEEGGLEEHPMSGEDGSGGARVRWVVDPVDGTVNYTHGFPWFAVSIGVEVDGVPTAGAVVEPVSGREWSAARGHGAFLDGRRLQASVVADPALAVVATGLGYDPDRRRRQAELIARMAHRVGDLRRAGCASLDLCAVAAGWVDGYYEHGLHAWDLAAGALIAEEAGARVVRPVTMRGAGSAPDPALDVLGAEALFAAGPDLAAGLAELLAEVGAAGL